jgi:hypothetical protein
MSWGQVAMATRTKIAATIWTETAMRADDKVAATICGMSPRFWMIWRRSEDDEATIVKSEEELPIQINVQLMESKRDPWWQKEKKIDAAPGVETDPPGGSHIGEIREVVGSKPRAMISC